VLMVNPARYFTKRVRLWRGAPQKRAFQNEGYTPVFKTSMVDITGRVWLILRANAAL
jgi:hypothetical protein